MVTDVAIVHAQPNRLRLRFPSMVRKPEFFAHAAETLRRHPEVVRVVANALTGSLLLEFGSDLGGILKLAEDAGLFHVDPPQMRTPARKAVPEAAPRLDDFMEAAAVLLGGAFLGLAAWQTRKGKALPAGLTLVWYASGLLKGRVPTGLP
jgi:hypothetical protein